MEEEEKIIQIAHHPNNPNPTLLTNKGRVLSVILPIYGGIPKWADITPDLTAIEKIWKKNI
jgi:hypothetical protein